MKKLLFREQTLKTLLLVAASLGLGTRLVTELTVYMPRSRAHLCGVQLQYGNDNLVRGVATTDAQAPLACHPGYV